MKIDLQEKKQELILVATNAFDILTNLPKEMRGDDKERTGIQVLVREPGTRNLIFFSVGKPSEQAMFFSAEKAVRSHIHGDSASQNSSDPEKMEFAGSVSVCINGIHLQVSISGLKAEEDVAVAITILSNIFRVNPKQICLKIETTNGRLPDCFYLDRHYLCKFLELE